MQRDLRAIADAQSKGAPLLGEAVPLEGFEVKRRKKAADRNYANTYTVPVCEESADGTQVFLAWLQVAADRGYSGPATGFLVFVAEYLGRHGRQRTYRQLQTDYGRGRTFCVATMARLVADGLVEARDADPEQGESPVDGRFYRLLRPAEWDEESAPDVAAGVPGESAAATLARQRHAVRVRWVGMTVASLDHYYPGGRWWDRATEAAAVADERARAAGGLVGHLADNLRKRRKEADAVGRGDEWPAALRKIRRRELARALPEAVALRSELDADVRGEDSATADGPASDPLDAVRDAWALARDPERTESDRRWALWRVALAVADDMPDADDDEPTESKARGRFYWLRGKRPKVMELVTALQSAGAPPSAADLRAGVAVIHNLLSGGALPGL